MHEYYKSLRIIDGKSRWVVEDENGNIDKCPTREKLKNALLEDPPKRCYKCGRVNEDGNYDLKDRLCSRCHQNEENDKFRKPLVNFRTGNLSRYTAHGLGYIGVQIVAITNGVEDCNIKMDNFCFYIDLSKHTEYGYCEVKTGSFLLNRGRWVTFCEIKPWNFDNIFLVCMDWNRPWKNVCRIYIVSSEYVDISNITIYLGTSTKSSRWDRFKVDKVSYDNTYHSMKLENCNVLRKDGM